MAITMSSSHHFRKDTDKKSLSLDIDEDHTSTTKALLVSVLAPRKFFSKNTNSSDEEQETTTTKKLSPKESREQIKEVVKENKDNAKNVEEGNKNASAKKKEKHQEEKRNDEDEDTDTCTSKNEEDTSRDVKEGDKKDSEKKKEKNQEEKGNGEDSETDQSKDEESDTDPDDSAEKGSDDDGSSNGSDDDDEDKVTAEEAAAVVPDEEKNEHEVNVEELLRIAMQDLLKEWHLLNVPTYSNVMDKQTVSNEVSLHSLFSDRELREREVKSFIRMDVMARPASLGIILERLERIGVGTEFGTISVFKAELCKTASPFAHLPPEEDSDEDESASGDEDSPDASRRGGKSKRKKEKEKEEKAKEERKNEESEMEWKNAATRLRIEQVREQIVEQASFSFDFIALLMTASTLAGVGLITNDSVVIVASMLVAPIMGPVLGMTFGTRIKDWPLVRMSFKNEVFALMGCVVIGACIGLCAGFTTLATEMWPTNEMAKRGEWTGVLTGIAVAIPSGMGVCLSILGGNTSSLVGVAISASLLPPAVNAGICLLYSVLVMTDTVISDSGLDAAEFARIGAVSFALTSINIICIWLSGFVMFEIKEVAPTKEKQAFWAAKSTQEVRELQSKHGEHQSSRG